VAKSQEREIEVAVVVVVVGRSEKWYSPRRVGPRYSAHWAVVIDRMEDVLALDRPP